jgi:alcohol oxidase
MRPHPEELHDFGKEFEAVWKDYYEPAPDKPVVVASLFAVYYFSCLGNLVLI